MTVKLNLTIDETLVTKAKVYAAKNQTSVSKLIEGLLLKEIETSNSEPKLSKKFAGILSGKLLDDESIKREKILKKYGY